MLFVFLSTIASAIIIEKALQDIESEIVYLADSLGEGCSAHCSDYIIIVQTVH